MRRVLAFTADFEDEIAAWPARRPRPPHAAHAERALATCLLPLGRTAVERAGADEDLFLIDDDVPAETLLRLCSAGLSLAHPVRAPLTAPIDAALVPWGAAPSLIERGLRLGLRVDVPPPEVVRRVNSKAWSHSLERDLDIALPGACLVSSVDEARAAVAALGVPRWVLKDPFGFAGRGCYLGHGMQLDERGAAWAARALAGHVADPLVLEPWLRVRGELGVQLDVGPTETRVTGVTRSVLDGAGHYMGSRIGFPVGSLEERVLEVARVVGQRLAAEGYFGPAGIDALIHQGVDPADGADSATTANVRPLCEINARHTMGMVALRFQPLLAPGGYGAWLLLPRRAAIHTVDELVARSGLAPYDPATREGALAASPLPSERAASSDATAKGAFGLAVFLSSRDKAALLAAEHALLQLPRTA